MSSLAALQDLRRLGSRHEAIFQGIAGAWAAGSQAPRLQALLHNPAEAWPAGSQASSTASQQYSGLACHACSRPHA